MRQEQRPSFDELRDWLSIATSAREVEAALTRFAGRNGFKWFTYMAIDDVNVRAISNYPPDWQHHYLSERLAGIDPVVESAKAVKMAFAWSRPRCSPRLNRVQAQLFRDAATVGIRSGVSIPVHGAYGVKSMLTLSGSDADIDDSILIDQFNLLSIGAFLHAYLSNSGGLVLSAAECPLTHTQLETLAWLVQGKTCAEIATIRNISTRSIEYQLSAIRQKLGAMTTVRAVAIAIERKWLSL